MSHRHPEIIGHRSQERAEAEAKRARIAAVLVTDPDLDNDALGERFGLAVATIQTIRGAINRANRRKKGTP